VLPPLCSELSKTTISGKNVPQGQGCKMQSSSESLKKLGADLAAARKRRRISTASMSARINVTKPTLKRIERAIRVLRSDRMSYCWKFSKCWTALIRSKRLSRFIFFVFQSYHLCQI
jgi:DNA-binding XRE family transcriptional regulator